MLVVKRFRLIKCTATVSPEGECDHSEDESNGIGSFSAILGILVSSNQHLNES